MNYFRRNLKSVRKRVKRLGTSRTEMSVQGKEARVFFIVDIYKR
jgi:hypothetical protein